MARHTGTVTIIDLTVSASDSEVSDSDVLYSDDENTFDHWYAAVTFDLAVVVL